MSTSNSNRMAILLDASLCLFHETYMVREYYGGQEIAQLLFTWLSYLFPEVRYFTICLVGEIGLLFHGMNRSWVNIHHQKSLDFYTRILRGGPGASLVYKANRRQLRAIFTADARILLKSNYKKVLLGALSEDVRAVLGPDGQNEKVALLKTIEPFDKMSFEGYQTVENREIFRDRLYSTGMWEVVFFVLISQPGRMTSEQAEAEPSKGEGSEADERSATAVWDGSEVGRKRRSWTFGRMHYNMREESVRSSRSATCDRHDDNNKKFFCPSDSNRRSQFNPRRRRQ